jgi:hypothetical protein
MSARTSSTAKEPHAPETAFGTALSSRPQEHIQAGAQSAKLILPRPKATNAEMHGSVVDFPSASSFVPPSPKGMQKFMKMYYTELETGD